MRIKIFFTSDSKCETTCEWNWEKKLEPHGFCLVIVKFRKKNDRNSSFIVYFNKAALFSWLAAGLDDNITANFVKLYTEKRIKWTCVAPPGVCRYFPGSVGLVYLCGGKTHSDALAAAGYRLGFKGPFAPLKKQQLPLDPRFVRHADTPTSTRTQQAL